MKQRAGKSLLLHFATVSTNPVTSIEIVLSTSDRWKTIKAVPLTANNYQAAVPSDMLISGLLDYRIMVICGVDTTIFPSGRNGNPWSWDNKANTTYTIRLVPADSPIILWDAETDWESTFKIWNRAVTLKPTIDGETALALTMKQLPDPIRQITQTGIMPLNSF